MKRHDHKAEKEDAANEALESEVKVRGQVLPSKVADEGAGEHLSHVSSCNKEVVAPFGLIEVANLIDESPEKKKDHNPSPKFCGDKEERLNPVSVNGDPVGIFLPELAEEPIG